MGYIQFLCLERDYLTISFVPSLVNCIENHESAISPFRNHYNSQIVSLFFSKQNVYFLWFYHQDIESISINLQKIARLHVGMCPSVLSPKITTFINFHWHKFHCELHCYDFEYLLILSQYFPEHLFSGDIEITTEFLVDVDKLIQLIESPIFTCKFSVHFFTDQ